MTGNIWRANFLVREHIAGHPQKNLSLFGSFLVLKKLVFGIKQVVAIECE